jgi:hypothetical protein
MVNNDRTGPVVDDAAAPAAKPESRALVPLTPFVERRSRKRSYRWAPDPTFVTHLIAQSEQVPQARRIRRASLADAQAAYHPQPTSAQGTTTGRTRQVI